MAVELFEVDGEFKIGGLSLDELMRDRKTPFYVYSADVIRHKYALLKEHFPKFDIFYSFKPNPNVEVAKVLLNEGACAEISSGGELRAALEAGFSPGNIIFVSPAKSEDEINLALREGIYSIVVDSVYELKLVDKLACIMGIKQRVSLRINTLEGPKLVHEQMVGVPSKFGFDEEVMFDELSGVVLKNAFLSGIQVYAASQVLDLDALKEHFENVINVALRVKESLGIEIENIDFGGGFGVPYGDESELDVGSIGARVSELIKEHGDKLPGCRYIMEIGRYLVAECGVFVTRVMRLKESRGEWFITCDGGMNAFTRMAFVHVVHPVRILNKMSEVPVRPYNVCGPCCSPLDIIGDGVELPEPEMGDVIGVFNAGAYGFTMSMLKFISFGDPGEYLVDGGSITRV